MKWSKAPFIRLLFPLILGILIGIYTNFHLPILISILLLGSLFLTFFIQKYRWSSLFGICTMLCILSIGITITYYHNALNAPNYFQKHLVEGENIVIGKVAETPTMNKWIKCNIAIKAVMQGDKQQPVTGQALVYLKSNDTLTSISYGDEILFNAEFIPTQSSKNPHQFNYKDYLKFRNIHHQAFVQSSNWQILRKGQSNTWLAKIKNLRMNLLDSLSNHLTNERELVVGSALILGYKANITDEVQAAYTDTGAIHVLAVSGLHVGIMAFILKWLLFFLPTKNKIGRGLKIALNIIGIWIFAFLAGAAPSVIRASLMFSFLLWASYQKHPTYIYNTLGISAFLMLLYDPYYIMNVGFQLSYSAVIGIVYLQPKLFKLLFYVPKVHFKWKHRTFASFLAQFHPRQIGKGMLYNGWQLITVSIAAQLGTLPITLFYFHQFPIWFWLSGLVVIPAAMLIMIFGLLSFLPLVGSFCGFLLNKVIWVMNEAIFWMQHLPLGVIKGISISLIMAILIYLFIGSLTQLLLQIRQQPIRWISRCSIIIVAILWLRMDKFHNVTHQKQVFLYQINKNTLIDFVDRQSIVSFKQEDLPKSVIEYAAMNNRFFLQIPQQQTIQLSIGDSIQNQVLWSDGQFFQFYNTSFFLLNQDFSNTDFKKEITVDYLILSNNPSIDLKQILQQINFSYLLIDGSNNRWNTAKWITYCTKNNIPYWNTREQGYWNIQL